MGAVTHWSARSSRDTALNSCVNSIDLAQRFASGYRTVGSAMDLASKILVPVDFSSGSKAAVEYAAALAKALQATITLLHIHDLPALMNSIVPGADNAVDAENDRAFSEKWLEQLRVEAQQHSNVEMRVMVEHGSAPEDIVSISHSGGFDMIVMGTHGRTGVRHVLMGSVAEAVVRRALCPVLTIHLPVPAGRA
jgi:nucleotide-binding universal stress UspA family protein